MKCENKIHLVAFSVVVLVASSCTLRQSSTLSTTAASTANSAQPSSSVNSSIGGSGNTVVPTSNAITGRIEAGLLGSVSHLSGNFAQAVANASTNLPDSRNPVVTTGLDQIPLLIYAACSDANPSTFGVNISNSVEAAGPSLIAAGVKMLDQHVAGMASSGPVVSQVAAVFSNLVSQHAGAGSSTKLTFISVCMAANSYGVAMQGF